jgi:hypothetical protein
MNKKTKVKTRNNQLNELQTSKELIENEYNILHSTLTSEFGKEVNINL